MTKIIAFLVLVGQFDVAVETSRGYFIRAYPDNDVGVTAFLDDIRLALEADSGRFFPCVVYDGPPRDLFQSPLAERIGLTTTLRTGQRAPGTGHGPSLVGSDEIKSYAAKHRDSRLDARTAEKICLAAFPKDYIKHAPTGAEFYRRDSSAR